MRTCIRCQHKNDVDNNYCIKCGAPLKNVCTNQRCKNYEENIILSDEAAYCPICGSETLFKTYGLASSPLGISDDDLPF
ncbi:TPA: zinc ribbon domain-containing protein [Streptococcus pyogenes]|nr:zinc ribbon domain-containing protein [Streptococcus pyogenes]HER0886572.1 zinc ribbon domain-containing protein [Streptococcus pyogenes]HER0889988.1 zinc ribbon domain-containing protein [Streptococcus pyogenes]HER0893355.1 zinc ribbon domain-containing protein [Streptococcus pyogenes]